MCRTLLMNDSGSHLLSGSADNTIKLWDMGQQRCLQTLAVHTDSVWSLLASDDFSVIYSGGRDSNVYRYSFLLCCRLLLPPVLAINLYSAMRSLHSGTHVYIKVGTQHRWEHCLPKCGKACLLCTCVRSCWYSRYNLTDWQQPGCKPGGKCYVSQHTAGNTL